MGLLLVLQTRYWKARQQRHCCFFFLHFKNFFLNLKQDSLLHTESLEDWSQSYSWFQSNIQELSFLMSFLWPFKHFTFSSPCPVCWTEGYTAHHPLPSARVCWRVLWFMYEVGQGVTNTLKTLSSRANTFPSCFTKNAPALARLPHTLFSPSTLIFSHGRKKILLWCCDMSGETSDSNAKNHLIKIIKKKLHLKEQRTNHLNIGERRETKYLQASHWGIPWEKRAEGWVTAGSQTCSSHISTFPHFQAAEDLVKQHFPERNMPEMSRILWCRLLFDFLQVTLKDGSRTIQKHSYVFSCLKCPARYMGLSSGKINTAPHLLRMMLSKYLVTHLLC